MATLTYEEWKQQVGVTITPEARENIENSSQDLSLVNAEFEALALNQYKEYLVGGVSE